MEVFTFDQFFNKDSSSLNKKSHAVPLVDKSIKIKENISTEPKVNDSIKENVDKEIENEEVEKVPEIPEEEEEVIEEVEEPIIEKADETEYYNLFLDKNENFSCDISIEGANINETEARLVIESDDWILLFKGEIKNNKCLIPIRKLNILKEGQIGNIKLEVISEGNIFIPWEDEFKIKKSKNITVKVNKIVVKAKNIKK
jgi:hypothetical protein